jgi:hypothetical protein
MASPSQADFSEEAAKKDYKAPYSHNHPIPTIQRYREHRNELNGQQKQAESAQHTEEDDSKTKRAFNSVKAIFKDEDEVQKNPAGDPYPTANRNTEAINHQPYEHDSELPRPPPNGDSSSEQNSDDAGSAQKGDSSQGKDEQQDFSATEKAIRHTDPRDKRKDMKHNKREGGRREITDPVTHLPLVIRDSTAKDLRRAPENEPAPGSVSKTATGVSGASKSTTELDSEKSEVQDSYDGMQRVFPPPEFDDTKAELFGAFQLALTVGLASIIALTTLVAFLILVVESRFHGDTTSDPWWLGGHEDNTMVRIAPLSIVILVASGVAIFVIIAIRGWLGKKVEGIWEDEVWDSARVEEQNLDKSDARLPESVAWMNGLLASVWPLINPDLFASVVDMLEDVMQASLPKIIRMVSVDDLGQGSESIRILGIRWLPTGAASRSVDEKGNLKPSSNKEENDRMAPGQGEEDGGDDRADNNSELEDVTAKKKQEQYQKEEERQVIREGMEAEQGDFVNLELAFSYRARSSGKSLKSKAKNAHLYLKFYLPGGIFVPVWVELRGMIGTMRLRLQLTPDPPFFSLCTLTFLGQPHADLSCVPLSKHLPNLMNVPLISSFVQTSIDAALAEYVAPKSLTLDLKDMLVGDDFKKDTVTRGAVMIFIKEAKDFKEGDGSVGPMKGSSDSYVTCSWGKFGKTVTSTRIIECEQNPKWHEWAYILVSPEEVNADEKLRLQLWDSDKYTADDDLGRVEVDLKELMHSPKTKNQQFDREDRFKGGDTDEDMPGTLWWSVGYYDKIRITEQQLVKQNEDNRIKTKDQLKNYVSETSESKLREATAHDESKELNQQKAQDYKEHEDALICAATPDPNYASGILSVQIHNITGLEVESLQKRDKSNSGDREDEAEQSDDLPSSYCTIILNHQKIFMTRTKPKNAKPFFNAGAERFIRDWRNTEVMISVRDSREGENDALLGIIYLPLHKVFEKRSQVVDVYRLVGGIGFGRARISLVFRSIELQLPKELLGWDYGTLEIKAPMKVTAGAQADFAKYRIKLRSNMSRAKMSPDKGEWRPKHGEESVFLPCSKRYAMPLMCEFRKSSLGPDSTPAFAIFWLHEIPDEEEKAVAVKVWKGGKDNLQRATTCAGYEGLEDDEQALGEIEVTMKFWRGLSGYHKRYAQKAKNADMRNVMEVLDTANDEEERDYDDGDYDVDDSETDGSLSTNEEDQPNPTPNSQKPGKLVGHTNDSSSELDSDHDEDSKNPTTKVRKAAKNVIDGRQSSEDGSRGPIAQVKDYKDHHKQLHRKHRGIMQWKGARTANWATEKMRAGKGRVGGVFEHGEKGQGVETEI